MFVAQILNSAGYPEALTSLTGDRDHNPLYRWREAFQDSRALSEAGRYAQSIRVLTDLLAELQEATGTAVGRLQPKIFGALGGGLDSGRRHARRALLD